MKKKYKPKAKTRVKTSNIILTFMLIFLAIFTVTCLVWGFIAEYEPSTLITCVFAFCGTEGGLLAWIKVTKEKNPKKSKSEEKEE